MVVFVIFKKNSSKYQQMQSRAREWRSIGKKDGERRENRRVLLLRVAYVTAAPSFWRGRHHHAFSTLDFFCHHTSHNYFIDRKQSKCITLHYDYYRHVDISRFLSFPLPSHKKYLAVILSLTAVNAVTARQHTGDYYLFARSSPFAF